MLRNFQKALKIGPSADIYSASLTAIVLFSRPADIRETVEEAKLFRFPSIFKTKGYTYIVSLDHYLLLTSSKRFVFILVVFL